MKAKLLVDIDASGEMTLIGHYKAGWIGTIEDTDVQGFDYEFYPDDGAAGVCVHADEIVIIDDSEVVS